MAAIDHIIDFLPKYSRVKLQSGNVNELSYDTITINVMRQFCERMIHDIVLQYNDGRGM